jgi:hypothetical protein
VLSHAARVGRSGSEGDHLSGREAFFWVRPASGEHGAQPAHEQFRVGCLGGRIAAADQLFESVHARRVGETWNYGFQDLPRHLGQVETGVDKLESRREEGFRWSVVLVVVHLHLGSDRAAASQHGGVLGQSNHNDLCDRVPPRVSYSSDPGPCCR